MDINQEATIRLSDNLVWSFDQVSVKTEQGVNIVKDLSEWFKKRAQVSSAV